MTVMVDPPEGWRYGFPKPLDQTISYREFLLVNGYPEKDLELALDWSRYWTSNDWPE